MSRPRQALYRTARFHRAFIVLAALALALRALLPTGYMVAAVDGHAQLALCPAGLHPGAHMHHMAGSMHDSAGLGHATGFTHAAQQCPFALAGGPGLSSPPAGSAQPYFMLLRPARTLACASVPAAPPLRHLAARGPPALV